MITLEAAQTLRGVGESATTLTYTITGMELGTSETYKVLQQGQLAAAAATIYTVPGSTSALIKSIHIVNTNVGATKTFQLFIGGTAGANAITPVVTIPAGGWATYDEDGWAIYSASGQISLVGATGAKGDTGLTGSPGSNGVDGVSIGYQYKWSTNTASSDPTSGYLKVNNATLASVTALYISETDDLANNIAAILATWDDSTSTIKARVKITKKTNTAVFWLGTIGATLTDNGTWDTFTVTHVASAGSFSADDIVYIYAVPTGDKGDTGATGGKPAGQIFLSASGMWPTITNGSAYPTEVEFTTTNNKDMFFMDFADGATVLHAQCMVAMPSDYDGGTVTATFYWTAAGTSTNSVVWGCSGRSYGDLEAIDQALGTAQTSTDAHSATANQIQISPATSAITFAGTPAAGELVLFDVYRDPTNGSDTFAATARLIGVMIAYTRA